MSCLLLLSANNLVKHYAEVAAVDGVSFHVPEGECFGLLGPNGAGKTTTLEIIEGVTPADSGEVLYQNAPRNGDYLQRIGIQSQYTALQDFQTVGESLQLFASFYNRHWPLHDLIERCHLEDLLDRDTAKLSGGQRQRLLLAIALVNDPDLVFLDEPTTGLDPQSRRNFWALVQGIKAAGKTVLLTTHYMEEASVLCDRIAIIDHGRIIVQGAPQALLDEHFPSALIRLPASALGEGDSNLHDFEIQGDEALITTDDIHDTLTRLGQSGLTLDNMQVSRPSLDDLFLKLTGHGLRES